MRLSAVVGAANAADAHAVGAARSHHTQIAGALAAQVEAFVEAASRGDLRGAVSES